MSEITTASATGRRKNAIAHVWLSQGSGQIIINGRTFEEYLPTIPLQNTILLPFQHGHLINRFDVKVVAKGGGIHGQCGAISLGISRALIQLNPEVRKLIKPHGLLTRDGRMKERKKPGRPGARKRFQFSKR